MTDTQGAHAQPEALRGAPPSAYSQEDRAFYTFWYGHMLNEWMQPPLAGVSHSTARYIWDAALRTAHVQKPAEIEHVADDVSKNGAELNMSAQQPAPATQQAGERVYAFRRKGLADFCTCDEARYEELSNKPRLFETRIFYTTPQPTHAQAVAMPLDEARRLFDAGWRAAALFCDREDVVADGIIGFSACPQFEAAFSAAHGIKGGQHGTE